MLTPDTRYKFILTAQRPGGYRGYSEYEFIYLSDNDLLNVAYKGAKTSLTTKLPAGERKNNFTIDFRVRVADNLGAYTEVRTPVQVIE